MPDPAFKPSLPDFYSTRLCWKEAIAAVVISIGFLICEHIKLATELDPYIPGVYTAFALCGACIAYCKLLSFDFTKDGITVRLCTFPVRRISWGQVKNMVFFTGYCTEHLPYCNNPPLFMLLLKKFRKYPVKRRTDKNLGGMELLRFGFFSLLHPISAVFVDVTDVNTSEDAEKVLETVKKLYDHPIEVTKESGPKSVWD